MWWPNSCGKISVKYIWWNVNSVFNPNATINVWNIIVVVIGCGYVAVNYAVCVRSAYIIWLCWASARVVMTTTISAPLSDRVVYQRCNAFALCYCIIIDIIWILLCCVECYFVGSPPRNRNSIIFICNNMYKCNTVVIANDVANWLSSACQRHEFTQKPYKNQTLASIKPHEAQWINVCSAVQFWSKGPRGSRLPWISYNSIYSEWLNIWGDCWLLDNSILDKMILGR